MRVEEQVQARHRAGDLSGAATVAIQDLGPSVARYLRAMVRDEEDVAEAFSDWSERLWRGIGSFEWRSSFRTWAFRLAFHAALDLCDRAHRRRERRFATGEASALAEEVRTTALRHDRRRRRLDELRAELTPDERTLLLLRLDHALAWDEVAAVLTDQATPVDAETVRKRFQRLKERLRELARARKLMD